MAGDSSSSSPYWPGFVDALTNVVIAMIFVIVVIAIALSFAMQLIVKKAADQVSQAEASRSAAVAQLANARAGSGAQGETNVSVGGELLRTARGADVLVGHVVSLRSVQDVITVVFTGHALTMDAATSAKLTADVRPLSEALVKANGHVSVRLSAEGPAMQFSDNQRSAYIRLIAVRNALLQAGVAAADIDVHIDQTTSSTDDSVTVALAPR